MYEKKINLKEFRPLISKFLAVILLTLFASLFHISVNGQYMTITGSVKNTSGEPVPGVTIVVKGTTQGTITDSEGSYSLPNVSADAILVISFVGMKTQEIAVEGRNILNVTMEEETIVLEEVVAIGYGTIRKSDLTGAIASVQGDFLAGKQKTQLSQALQGTMSGLMVTRTNSMANQGATIRIRGITTINDSDPLVIIDGIPGNLNDVNPNDVESISVLKDAAAASIYGSRAASGVIIVTTKRAEPGLSFDYNFEYGVETPTRIPENETAVEYMKFFNELKWNDTKNIVGNEYNTYAKDLIENYPSLHKGNPDQYPDTDWISLMLNDFAPRQSHNLSMNAGSENINTKASFGYDKIDALYDNRNYERYTIRANNDITFSKYLSTTIDLNAIHAIDKRPIADYSIPGLGFRFPGIYAAKWSDGRYAPGTTTGQNPYPVVDGAAGFNNLWDSEIRGKISVDFKPIENLKLSGIIAPAYFYEKTKKFVRQVPYTDWDEPEVIVGYNTSAPKTSLNEERNDKYSITTQFLADYKKTIGEHYLYALAGFENYYYFSENLDASRDEYELHDFPYLNLGPLTYRDNGGNASELAYRSWFGRIIYNYKNKYLFQANGRYDGSSRFAEEYRWGFFPSFSAGWVISEESFMQNLSGLSFLKIRASWGTLGNERIGNYPYQSTVSFGNGLYYQGNNIVSSQTAYVSQYAIKNISWETTESYNVGLDATFLNNKLRLTGDYYKKTTKDMLLAVEIPNFMGFANPEKNTGEMYTKGWDLELGWNDLIGDFKYSVSFNISDFRSVIGDIGGTEFLGSQVKFEGSEFNEWYGYLSDGLFQTQEEVDNSATVNSTVAPGDIKYIDISGPDGVPDSIISAEYDRALLGGSLPRYLYGGNIRLSYKNLDFSMTFQGVGKQNAYITYGMIQPFYGGSKLMDGDYWSHYNTAEQNKNVRYPRFLTSTANNNVMSDFWLFNGSYFRLKNITLGYSIPSKITQKAQINGLRIYASISDFLSLDKYPKSYDPEGSQFCITKSFVFGVAVSL